MNWHWPQVILAILLGISVLGAVLCNGNPRTGNHNGAVTILCLLLEAFLLYAGGFWGPIQ